MFISLFASITLSNDITYEDIDYVIDENAGTEEPIDPPGEGDYVVAAGEDLIIDLEVIENLTSLSFDYKVTSGTFNMALMMPDWGSFYGYYAFNGAGNVDPYDGVTVETQEEPVMIFGDFDSQTLEGEKVTEEIFANDDARRR